MESSWSVGIDEEPEGWPFSKNEQHVMMSSPAFVLAVHNIIMICGVEPWVYCNFMGISYWK